MIGIKRMVKSISFIMLLALLTGCQPTPQGSIVDDKGNSGLIDKIKNDHSSGKIDAPEVWDEQMEAGSIHVTVNADIMLPDVEKYSAYTASPALEFPLDLTKKMADVLFERESLYQVQLTDAFSYTRAELEKIIIEKRKEADDFEQYIKERGYSEVRDESIRNNYKQLIEEYNNQYENAPENIAVTDNPQWQYQDSGNEKLLYLMALNKDKTMRTGTLEISVTPRGVNLFYQRDFRKFYEVGPEIKDDIATLSVSAAEAQKEADNLLAVIKEVTGDDYRIFSHNTGYIRPLYQDPSKYDNIQNNPQCYMFTVYRCYNNVPAIYAQSSRGDNATELYADPWFPEQFVISVDDNGIANIMWSGLGIVKETISENVPMLSFEEIQEKFRQHMAVQWAYDSDPNIVRTDLKINRITLGMMRLIQRDNPDEYLMIPVWDFFGRLDEQYPDGMLPNHSNTLSNELFVTSFLTINAIDGSIINRNIGY